MRANVPPHRRPRGGGGAPYRIRGRGTGSLAFSQVTPTYNKAVLPPRIHLVRHGEVHNPSRVLYGRLPGFGLSERGHEMAAAAAEELVRQARPLRAIIVSPLLRARESAAPILRAFDLDPVIDERVIEPSNFFEGTQMRAALRNPRNWPVLLRPSEPSWGEPYTSIVRRMMAAVSDATALPGTGDIVVVSHQLPIWMVHRHVTGARLRHDPRQRRCELSSITTVERTPAGFAETDYRTPASSLVAGALDVGAV